MGDVTPIPKRPVDLRRQAWNSTLPAARSGLAAMSPKRRGQTRRRREVREAALARAGYCCEAADLVLDVACAGPLDVDEVEARGVNPGGHLDLENTQVLCRAHHEWRHAHPEKAEALGLRRRSTYERGPA